MKLGREHSSLYFAVSIDEEKQLYGTDAQPSAASRSAPFSVDAQLASPSPSHRRHQVSSTQIKHLIEKDLNKQAGLKYFLRQWRCGKLSYSVFHPSLIFVGKIGAYPSVGPLRREDQKYSSWHIFLCQRRRGKISESVCPWQDFLS